MRRLKLLIILSISFLLVGSLARAYSLPGQPTGFVNDFAGVLTAEERRALETKLAQFDKDTSNQISIAIIKDLGGDTVDNYANKLFGDWKIGQDKKDNGVLILVAINDRQMRIEVGYGLEGALTDAISSQIITNTLRPAFRSNDYYGGLNTAADQIIAATKGEYQPAASDQVATTGKFKVNADMIFWIILGVIYLLTALRRFLARNKGWWEGGAIGVVIGLLAALIFFSVIYFIILPVVFGILGLIFDYLVSRVLPPPKKGGRRGGGFWIFPGGFGGGGSSGGGGGFGGFGGGSSGGGGASGGW